MLRRLSLKPFILTLLLPLAACSTLPSSGPTGPQVIKAQNDPANPVGFELVELDAMTALPPAPAVGAVPAAIATAVPPRASDLIGPGDIIDIVVYEAGVTVFSGTGGGAGIRAAEAGGYDPSAHAEKLPALRVDDNGFVVLPYVGRIKVGGKTPGEVQQLVVAGLAGKSQNPQVLVSVGQSVTNSVIVGGEVGRAGRLPLATGRETLLDVIALSGGYRGEASDLIVRLERGGQRWSDRLANVLRNNGDDIRVLPGDRIQLLKQQMTFSVFGAPGRVEQLPFSSATMSLSEAVARAGGTNPNQGDPAAIFVFRFVPNPDGPGEKAVVYHLNMQKTGGYFVAQRFAMQDKDVLYFGNARANQPSKLIQLIGQLFTPIATVRAVAP